MAPPNPNPFAVALEKSAAPLSAPPGPRPSPDNTSTFGARDALRRLRRTRLARVVGSVVVASVVLCAAAGARGAIRVGARNDLEVSHASRVAMKERELSPSFHTTHDGTSAVSPPPPAAHVSKRQPRGSHHAH